MSKKNFLIKDLSDYRIIFKDISPYADSRTIIFLKGDLGSGKTTFVQKFLEYEYEFSDSSSPTFGIINSYEINHTKIYHYDLYRITKSAELEEIGFYENLDQNTLHFIEWPDIIPKQMAKPKFVIKFHLLSKERILSVNTVDE